MSSIPLVGSLIEAAKGVVHAISPTRVDAVVGIVAITALGVWAIEYLSNSRTNKLGNDGFQCIPNEACEMISYELGWPKGILESPKDMLAFRATNTLLYNESMSPSQWRALLGKYFPSALASARPNADYQKLYREHAIQRNHLKMINAPSHVFQMREGEEFTAFKVQGDFLFGCFKGTAKIWNIHTGQLICTFYCDSVDDEIRSLKVDKDILFVALKNRIKSFNIRTGDEIRTFSSRCNISCFDVKGNCLFAVAEGSFDQNGEATSKILIWGIRAGSVWPEYSWEGIDKISCFKAYDEGFLIVGHYDGRVELIQQRAPYSQRLCHTLRKDVGAIECIEIHGNLLYTRSKDGQVNLWDTKEGKSVPMRDEDVGRFHSKSRVGFLLFDINCPKAHGDYRFGDLANGRVKISNIRTNEVLHTFPVDKYGLQAIEVFEDFLFVGSEGTTRSWDLLPRPSIYTSKVLYSNLQILGQMTHALHAQDFDELQHLNKQLHPNYQWNLKDQSLVLNKEGQLCSEAILRVQTMACLEVLLHGVHNQNQNDVSQILKQLKAINEGNLNKLYGLLYEQCQPVTSDTQWGEHAFENVQGGPASRKAMIQAVQSLQALLREEWKAPK